MDGDINEIRSIKALIGRQFSSLTWDQETSADWDTFISDFLPSATLYPAARPAMAQTVAAFVERMKGVAEANLRAFQESVLGTDIRVFGNVAIAAAGCQMIENGAEVKRGVELLLLVKSEGRWQIVAQAWDTEGPGKTLPTDLG